MRAVSVVFRALSDSHAIASFDVTHCQGIGLRSLSFSVCLAVSGIACGARVEPSVALVPSCLAPATRRWATAAEGDVRSLRVWIDAESQVLDGWRPYGRQRLRFAMAEWNALKLPMQFVEARSARESDVVVDIVAAIPTSEGDTDLDQAGLTHLTYLESGAIARARILIAVAAPTGMRYRITDQQANLVHELGHALGLGHAAETSAVMAVRRRAFELTGADHALARKHYATCAGPNEESAGGGVTR